MQTAADAVFNFQVKKENYEYDKMYSFNDNLFYHNR